MTGRPGAAAWYSAVDAPLGLASRSGIPHFLLPSLMAAAEAQRLTAPTALAYAITLSEILSGSVLGDACHPALGMILSPRLQRWLMPLVLTSQGSRFLPSPCWCCGWL